jgi:hypothetical protein
MPRNTAIVAAISNLTEQPTWHPTTTFTTVRELPFLLSLRYNDLSHRTQTAEKTHFSTIFPCAA